MSTIGERLREELAGKNVSEVARALGVVRNTIYNWAEKGNAPLGQFAQLTKHGVDLTYVLTGTRSVLHSRGVPSEIQELVDQFEDLTPEQQQVVRSTVDAFLLANVSAKKSRLVRRKASPESTQ